MEMIWGIIHSQSQPAAAARLIMWSMAAAAVCGRAGKLIDERVEMVICHTKCTWVGALRHTKLLTGGGRGGEEIELCLPNNYHLKAFLPEF